MMFGKHCSHAKANALPGDPASCLQTEYSVGYKHRRVQQGRRGTQHESVGVTRRQRNTGSQPVVLDVDQRGLRSALCAHVLTTAGNN